MKRLSLCLVFCLFFTVLSFADVNVKSYFRKDGTFVPSHVMSSPDNVKWNNYGPSKSSSDSYSPQTRDYDHDGIPNQYDHDDDNDGVVDDNDSNQYGR
ncbi:MAG TPA: hypothetical protein VJA17_00350 [Candidatus Omnitrophota bacterium]|nr:hypothetical protein [Candidatus Omnitrophota bacterium]